MKSRLENLPTFETIATQVKALHYNLVQVGFKRIGSPLRFPLPRLRTLDLYLEKEAWIVLDKSMNDIPVMAWVDFQVEQRDNLHKDITCKLKIYHSDAAILIQKVMEAMVLLIGEQLDSPDESNTKVIALKK